jgi:nitrate/TMAO reductase-like tetraheme cytochrome c subunit
MQVACHRCHAGASVANFRPTDPDCVSCHYDRAARTTNPPHVGLGWINQNCDRCHLPTAWRPAVVK